jgi:hypothetical protein
MKVVDIAGIEVGDVTDVGRDRFRLRLSGGSQLWLSDYVLLGLATNQVLLVCGTDRIERYRVDPPLLPGLNW